MSALSLRLRPARPRWQRARGETKADGDKLADMASFLELEGRWNEALEYRRKSVTLDPSAAGYASGLATNLLWLRRHGEARTAADRYLILGPTNPEAYQLRAMVALAQGKLNEAQAVLRRGEARVPKDELLAFVAY